MTYTLGALAGAASAAINGGNILKGAIIGGISGAIFAGIGVSGWEDTAKVLAHGVAGGFMSVVHGLSQDLITNPEYAGTYNYVNPKPGAPWYHPKNILHGIVDVVPYCIGGNNRAGAGPSCF